MKISQRLTLIHLEQMSCSTVTVKYFSTYLARFSTSYFARNGTPSALHTQLLIITSLSTTTSRDTRVGSSLGEQSAYRRQLRLRHCMRPSTLSQTRLHSLSANIALPSSLPSVCVCVMHVLFAPPPPPSSSTFEYSILVVHCVICIGAYCLECILHSRAIICILPMPCVFASDGSARWLKSVGLRDNKHG